MLELQTLIYGEGNYEDKALRCLKEAVEANRQRVRTFLDAAKAVYCKPYPHDTIDVFRE